MRSFRVILLLALLVGICCGQQGPSSDTLTLVAAPPAPAMSVTVRVNGTIGSDTRFYWVVVRLPIGRIPPYGPATAFQINYQAGGTVTINWNGVAGAIGYDVIRTVNTSFPGQGSCSNCLLASNITALTTTDTGASLASYSLTTVAAATMNAVLNNRDYSTPRWIIPTPLFLTDRTNALIFPDGSVQNTAGGGGGGSVTHTGVLTLGQMLQGNGGADITVSDLTGDIVTSGTMNTAIQSGVVTLLKLDPTMLSGSGAQLCTVTGSTVSTRIVVFDAFGNCTQSLASIDVSGNITTPGSQSTGVGGATSGATLWGVQAGLPTLPGASGFAGFGVNTAAIATTYVLDMPTAGPTLANSVMVFPASPTSGHYQGTFLQISAGGGGGVIGYSATGLTLTANTRFAPVAGGGTPSTTEADVQAASPAGATVTNFFVNMSAPIGAGNTAVFTWRKAGSDQTLTCTIAGAVAVSCNDTTHSFSVAAGDLVSIKVVTTGTVVVTPNLEMYTQFGTVGSNGTINSGGPGIAFFAAAGTAVSSSGNFTGAVKSNGASPPTQAACADLSNGAAGCSMSTTAGGDLSGTLPSPTVAKVNGSTPGGTCTNQAVTSLSSSAIPTCTTLTSAYVNNSIALTGTDINTSNQVTATHLAAALPVNQGGTGDLTLAIHGVLVGNATSGVSVTTPGTSGQVLTSNGAGADPTFQAAAGGGGTVTNTGTLTSGQLLKGNGGVDITVGNLAGDITTAGTLTTTLTNIPTGVTMAGFLNATAIAAPSTPAAGKGNVYVDGTSKNIAVKDDAGIIKHGVQSQAGSASNFVTAINDAGVVTTARPACADLSDSGSGCSSAATGGTVTNIATTSPITGGAITTTGTIACATCVVASSPGAGIARFAGSTQTVTSAELSGDVTTSGSNAATVVKVNGASVPASAPLVGTNNSNQIILATPFAVNAQTGTYQVLAVDFSSYKTITVASGTFTITLVASGSQPPTGQSIRVLNYGSGVVTIARSGQNINGGTASLVLNAGTATDPTGAWVVSDGTNYFAQPISGGAGITVYSSNGTNTFTKPNTCNYITFLIWGGGGSGAGGQVKTGNATITLGGTGGGGGAFSTKTINCTDATAPISVVVGAGGASVAASTSGNAGTDSKVTLNGTQILFAGGGGAGLSNNGTATVSGGSGGGAIGTGVNGSTTAVAGGLPAINTGANGIGGQGGGGALGASALVNGEFGGGGGGGGAVASASGSGGSSIYGGAGGGGGGPVTASTVAQNGGSGGAPQSYVVGGGGANGAGCTANGCTATGGTAGSPASTSRMGGPGGGGGGACASTTASGTCTAGNGAAGASPGGGGGGGGAANTNGGTGTAGTGGAGADGYAVVIVN